MKKMLRLPTFKRKMGYMGLTRDFNKRIKYLQDEGAILVQQSGFYAHSSSHPKIVIIKDETQVLRVFDKKGLLALKERKRKQDLERRLRKLELFREWADHILKRIKKELGIACCPYCNRAFQLEEA